MFAVAQKVVCVDAATQANNLPTLLIEGGIYTVASLTLDVARDEPGITLVEMPVPFPSRKIGWHAWRFRAAIERDMEATRAKEPVHS
jgi:hypothetical protein